MLLLRQAMHESYEINGRIVVFVWTPLCLLHMYHLMFKLSLSAADVVCKLMLPFQNEKRKYSLTQY